MHQEQNSGPTDRPALTDAERAILAALLDGLTPDEIASGQGIAITTVRTHIMRLHQKFGVNRTVDVIRLALQAGRGSEHPADHA